jgi:deoxyribose-phosphate aldolase
MEKWDEKLAAMIDHTILRSNTTDEDVKRLCDEACKYRFASAVVQPHYVPLASRLLEGTGVAVCSVISFPFGAHAPRDKALEGENLMKAGAHEIDMVMNVGAFLSRHFDVVKDEFNLICSMCRGRVVAKIIIETAYLSREGIKKATAMGVEAGFDFIKTSTGYGPRGATVEDVVLMHSVAGDNAGIKASGGIRTRTFAKELVEAGATRLGCSDSLPLIALSD